MISTLFSTDGDLGKWIDTFYGAADASYAQEADRKSRSGFLFMMMGAAVMWYCKKQGVVALLSTEAEFYALAEAIKDALWIRQFMTELGFDLNGATTIRQDNKSTIAVALNPINHKMVKHMDIRMNFYWEHIRMENITIVYCPTEDMIADIFTKALPAKQHQKLSSLMGLASLADLLDESMFTVFAEYQF